MECELEATTLSTDIVALGTHCGGDGLGHVRETPNGNVLCGEMQFRGSAVGNNDGIVAVFFLRCVPMSPCFLFCLCLLLFRRVVSVQRNDG